MACKQSTTSSFCEGLFVTLECLERIYQGHSKDIVLQLATSDGYPLDLDTVTSIEIVLSDNRQYAIAKYYYPIPETSSATGGEEEELDILKDVWVDDLPIIILQSLLTEDTPSDVDDVYINKGRISITITEEVSNYLMIGPVFLEFKIVTEDNSTYMIKCFLI